MPISVPNWVSQMVYVHLHHGNFIGEHDEKDQWIEGIEGEKSPTLAPKAIYPQWNMSLDNPPFGSMILPLNCPSSWMIFSLFLFSHSYAMNVGRFSEDFPWFSYEHRHTNMGLSENSVPLNPMVLLIIIPMKNGYFIGKINPTFSDKPTWYFPDFPGANCASQPLLRAAAYHLL